MFFKSVSLSYIISNLDSENLTNLIKYRYREALAEKLPFLGIKEYRAFDTATQAQSMKPESA